MNTKYTIKNFRIFDEKGVSIDIKPITILTGCNSSGKSSIVKSLILLDSFLHDLKEDRKKTLPIELSKHCLDFSKKQNSILGNFSRVVNRYSKSPHITLEYSVHSKHLGENVTVSMEFARETNDELRNGHLHSIKVYNSQGTTIFHSEKWMGGKLDSKMTAMANLHAIKDQFFAFMYKQHIEVLEHDLHIEVAENKISKEDYDDYINNIKEFSAKWINAWGISFSDDVKSLSKGRITSLISQEFGKHIAAFDIPYENDVLCYIPIFDKVENLSKNDTIAYILSFKKQSDSLEDIYFNMLLEKLVERFSGSDKQSLIDFYRDEECLFIKNYSLHGDNAPSILYNQINFYSPYSTKVPSFNTNNGESEPLSFEDKVQRCRNKANSFDFKGIVSVLTDLSEAEAIDNEQYTNVISPFTDHNFHYHTANLISDYLKTVLAEVIVDGSPNSIPYISSSIVEQHRLYSLESSNEMSRLLKKYLETKRLLKDIKNCNFEAGQFVNKWAKMFGVADRYEIQVDSEGLGATIRKYSDNDDKGCLLSEQGYGVTQLFVLLLRIETAIMECFLTSDDNVTIAIEEPEVHLHPKFQSLLADLFVEAHNVYNVDFIVETHSEYLIRKLQTLIARNTVDKNIVSLLYVNSKDLITDNGEELIRSIGFREDGCLSSAFGSGFFDEADKLADELLNIRINAHGNN